MDQPPGKRGREEGQSLYDWLKPAFPAIALCVVLTIFIVVMICLGPYFDPTSQQ